jgi:AraC-like DNA-binding protein
VQVATKHSDLRVDDPTGTVSVRMLWPFARYLGDFERELSMLQSAGIDAAMFADPDARIPRSLIRSVVTVSIGKTGDMCLGLHAGECVEIADFAPVDQVTRNCATLREAIVVGARYSRLHDDGMRVTLIEDESTATLEILGPQASQSAVANEFQVTCVLKRLGLFLHEPLIPIEVHMRHDTATDASEYARVFRAPVRLGTERNALVLRREILDAPARRPNPGLFASFQEKAGRMLSDLERGDTFVGKVRRLLVERLEEGLNISEAARRLHVSEATLRRRLALEGTTYKNVVDTIRKELSLAYLEERLLPSEISYRVGFSNAAAFGRAFRRWTGTSPMEYKERRAREAM